MKTREVNIVASGQLSATHDGRAARLVGTLNIDEAVLEPNFPASTGITRMNVTEYNRPARLGPPRNASAASAPRPAAEANTPRRGRNPADVPILLDVTLSTEDIRVKGRGLDLQLATNAKVTGRLTNPTLTGQAEVIRGTYEFGGKRFVFDPAGRVTLDTYPSRIRLNLRATREDADITAIINVTGTAASPRIALSSEPELPQDEILARVLFGRSVTQLSALEAAQLASSVASLAGGGGFDVLGQLRELAGLDSLSFSGDGANLMVSGGRRISENVFLEVLSGGEDGPAVNVEWQVRRNVAVSSRVTGDGNAVISVRWRKTSR